MRWPFLFLRCEINCAEPFRISISLTHLKGIVRGPKPKDGDGPSAATPAESEAERIARLEKELQIATHAKEAAQRVAVFRERDLQKLLAEAQGKLAEAEERLSAAEREHRRDLIKLKEALRRADEAEFVATTARAQAHKLEEDFREDFPRGIPDKDDVGACGSVSIRCFTTSSERGWSVVPGAVV